MTDGDYELTELTAPEGYDKSSRTTGLLLPWSKDDLDRSGGVTSGATTLIANT